MTKEAGFLETIVKDTKSINLNVGTSSKDEVKTMPSLFDTMLSNANNTTHTPESEVSEKVVTSAPTKTAINSTSTETPLVSKQSNSNAANSEITPVKNGVPSVSLLDKLVQEASLQIQNESSNTQNVVKENPLQTTATNSNDTSKIKNTDLVVSKETEESIPKNVNVLNEISQKNSNNVLKPTNEMTPTSLLDQLLQEVNVQIEEENTIKSNDLASEKSENILSKESTLLQVVKQVVAQESTPLTPVNTTNTQNSETSTSLLDKLVKEASVQIQNESVKTLNTNEVEVVTTTQVKEAQTQEGLKVQEQKVLVEIKELKNQDALQNTLDGAKNNKESVPLVQTKIENTPVPNLVNEKVAQELTKVTEILNEKTSLTKEQLLNAKPQTETLVSNNQKEDNKSLLDKLLDETKATIKASETAKVKTSANAAVATTKTATEPILTNIYLSSLNKASQDAILEKNHEVKTLVANASSVKDVQKGADLLNLGLQSSEVVVQEEEFKQNVKNEFLSKLSINRDIVKHDITKMSEEIVAQSKTLKNEATIVSTTNLLASKNLPEIEINVSAANAYTIENRIIGARQQMGSMMSDLARNMYLNYKPPVTAFRMNLNPGNLGSIAVLIKNDKDNGLSISLNMSNVATLDSIVDNQGALRAALAKNFSTNANINLEFNMQEGKQEGNSGQHNKKQQQNHQATNDILESLSNQNDSNKVTNYM
jgi:hypothetical protein